MCLKYVDSQTYYSLMPNYREIVIIGMGCWDFLNS